MKNINKRVSELNALKETLDSSGVNLQELQQKVAELQGWARIFYKKPGKEAKAYISDLNQLAKRIDTAILVANIEGIVSTLADSAVAISIEQLEVRKLMNAVLKQVVLRGSVASAKVEVAQSSVAEQTQEVLQEDVKPRARYSRFLPRVELESDSESETSSEESQNKTPMAFVDDTPEEPKGYLEIIWNKLCEFYESVLEWISYYTPDCFKKAAKQPENSDFGNHSFFYPDSDGSSSSVDDHEEYSWVPHKQNPFG